MAHTSTSAPKTSETAVTQIGREIVSYCRVSSDEQRVHGLGLETQAAAIDEYAARSQGRIVARYQEAASGRRDTLRDRPELVKALNHAKRSGALLVIARWDRLARNVSVTAQLLESSIDFVACDNPYANRITIHILAAMAEYESQLKSERIKGVFALMKARGYVFPPGKFTPEAQKLGSERASEVIRARTKALYADLIPLVVCLRTRGYTLEEVASQLNGLGHRNQRKNHWTRGNVWKLLLREGLRELAARQVPYRQNPGELLRIRARQAYAAIIPSAVSSYAAGKSTSAIAAMLNRRGYKTTAWSPWTSMTVLALLKREGAQIRKITIDDRRFRIKKAISHSLRNREARSKAADRAADPLVMALLKREKTYVEIAVALNRKGLRSPNGGPWSSQKIGSMMSRRRKKRSR